MKRRWEARRDEGVRRAAERKDARQAKLQQEHAERELLRTTLDDICLNEKMLLNAEKKRAMEATREFTQTPLLFVSGVGCDASARNQKMNQRNARLQAEQHLVAKVREKEKHDAEEERREAD